MIISAYEKDTVATMCNTPNNHNRGKHGHAGKVLSNSTYQFLLNNTYNTKVLIVIID